MKIDTLLRENSTLDEDHLHRSMERSFLCSRLGIKEEQIVFLRQTHGTHCLQIAIDIPSHEHAPYFAEGDALFTDRPGIALCIRTADCLPIFFAGRIRQNLEDDQNKLRSPSCISYHHRIGLIHAGWRGMASGIIEQALRTFLQSNANKHDTKDFIEAKLWYGPSIGGDVYEVGTEVIAHFPGDHARAGDRVRSDDHFPAPGNRYLLDLQKEASERIHSTIDDDRFDVLSLPGSDLSLCTYKDNKTYFSHRHGDRGRNLNVIMLKNERLKAG